MRFSLIFLLCLLLLTGCKSNRIPVNIYKSKEKLEKLGYDFTKEDFFRAINEKQPNIIKLFIDSGMSPDTTFNIKYREIPAIFYALNNNDDLTVQLLIHSKANLNASVNGVSVLMKAAEKANPEIVSLLIQAGAKVNFRGENGVTPLMVAIERENNGIIWILIHSGADVNARDLLGFTPLMRAVEKGNIDTIRELIEQGADVFALSKNGTPLYKFIGEKNRKNIELLLHDAGAKF